MNETGKIESIFGGEVPAGDKAADDKDARIAELERELQREKVEAGRLRKTNDELAALREENARLKAQKDAEDAIESVPEKIRSEVPDDFLKASGAMAARVSERMKADMERQREETKMLREEIARRDRNLFAQRINMRYPGFLDSVGEGGQKHEAWVRYQRYNSASIVKALGEGDFDTIAYHIETFCREIGVQVPSESRDGSAAPDPRTVGGGVASEAKPSGRTYTSEEYMALYDAVETARDKGDYAEVARLNAEIRAAPAEGRVK